MKKFDCEKKLKRLTGDFGVKRDLACDIGYATANRSLWTCSSGFVVDGLLCVVLGLPNEATVLFSKAKIWIEQAIATNEKAVQFEETSHKFHHHLYSIIQWLCDGFHDVRNLGSWRTDTLAIFKNHPDWVDTDEVELEAVTFINAGACEELIALAAPSGIDSIKCSGANEKQMALTLAAQALTQKFPEDKVAATVKKFLDDNVGRWLNDGQAVRAAEWMKVVYWKRGEAGISSFDAVLKCLDHVEH